MGWAGNYVILLIFLQTTISEKFVDCTVLTIAHRINTIIDSTRLVSFLDHIQIGGGGSSIQFSQSICIFLS